MATSIIPLAIAPPVTDADRQVAARYTDSFAYGARWREPEHLIFHFTRHDGSTEDFSPAELRATTWWHAMPFDIAMCIEAHLFPWEDEEERSGGVVYVARCTEGRLVRGSRLSEYFDENDGIPSAEWQRLRLEHPDAATFGASSVAEAERLLNAMGPGEGTRLNEERQAIARFNRHVARLAEVRS